MIKQTTIETIFKGYKGPFMWQSIIFQIIEKLPLKKESPDIDALLHLDSDEAINSSDTISWFNNHKQSYNFYLLYGRFTNSHASGQIELMPASVLAVKKNKYKDIKKYIEWFGLKCRQFRLMETLQKIHEIYK